MLMFSVYIGLLNLSPDEIRIAPGKHQRSLNKSSFREAVFSACYSCITCLQNRNLQRPRDSVATRPLQTKVAGTPVTNVV